MPPDERTPERTTRLVLTRREGEKLYLTMNGQTGTIVIGEISGHQAKVILELPKSWDVSRPDAINPANLMIALLHQAHLRGFREGQAFHDLLTDAASRFQDAWSPFACRPGTQQPFAWYNASDRTQNGVHQDLTAEGHIWFWQEEGATRIADHVIGDIGKEYYDALPLAIKIQVDWVALELQRLFPEFQIH